MRINHKIVASTTAIALLGTGAVNSQQKEEKPMNVVFFLVDDLGWMDVGCYGSSLYETPNIDKMASSGVRFTSAYAACHVSSPTRASLLTGKYPASINLTDWLPGRKDFPFQKLANVKINQQLPYQEITISSVLKKRGYSTAIFGKWHLGEDPELTLRHGFDIHIPQWDKGWPNKGYYSPYGLDGLEGGEEGEYLTDRLTDEAIKYIEANKSRPFFLYLSHFAVHDPIEGREDLVEKYKRKIKLMQEEQRSRYILEGNPDSKSNISSSPHNTDYDGYRIFPDNKVKIKQIQDNAHFAAMVESMDASLGRVMQKLEELGIEDRTVVIFYSDNGGMSAANFFNPEKVIKEGALDKAFSTSNLPLRAGKGWLYEGGIRVPLIIKWPGAGLQGAVCDVPVTSPDFFPTILEMLNIKDKSIKNTDGESITSLLKGKKRLKRDAIYWHFPHYSNHGMQSPGGAVRSGDYKLLEYFENNTIQLFNLKDDIEEQHDLSTSHPEKVKELKEKLSKWRKSVNAKMMLPNPDYKQL
jgi:arylsulfatase A-like enzyme